MSNREMLSSNERVHELKCWPEFFEHVWSGAKPFEIRKNDRDYQVNDWLELREWDPATQEFSGRQMLKRVTFLTDWEQKPGYVVLGLGR
jgi:hypothetical protein